MCRGQVEIRHEALIPLRADMTEGERRAVTAVHRGVSHHSPRTVSWSAAVVDGIPPAAFHDMARRCSSTEEETAHSGTSVNWPINVLGANL